MAESTSAWTSRLHVHDEVYRDFLNQPDLPQRWLLEQTIYTGPSRRSLLPHLPLKDGMRVLDVGSGFGALAFDLAATKRLDITALDSDDALTGVAERIARALDDRLEIVFEFGSRVDFVSADVYELRSKEELGVFDFAAARFLFQHLSNPYEAVMALRSRLKPGGVLCVIDVDDGLTITYPENTNTGFAALQRAFAELQSAEGGDRNIGRKMPHLLKHAGFDITATALLPQTQFIQTTVEDPGVQLTIRRFEAAKDDMVAHGILGASQFDDYLAAYRQEVLQPQFHITSQVVILATKPLEEV